MRRVLCFVATGLACLLTLAACGSFVDASQPRTDASPVAANELGQTFVAHHDGLTGVDVALAPGSELATLTLHDDPGGQTLARAQAQAASEGPWTRFTFAPLAHSHGQRYYLAISAPDPLTASSGPAGAYRDGALYIDGVAREAQLTFRLVYDPLHAALGLLVWLLRGLLPGLAALALLLLPGAALLAWLAPPKAHGSTGAVGSLVLAATLSFSLLPLLMLAAERLHLRLGPAAAWGLLLVSALALAARLLPNISKRRARETLAGPAITADRVWAVAALLIGGLIVGVRLLVVRSLQVPLWGDSHQHTTIVQLMLDQGGLFTSWAPYAPFNSFTIHFGFHAATTFLAWLTGTESPRAVVLAGQVWNVLAALAPYPLAARLAGAGTRGRWAGLSAVLVAGLLTPVPMFYVNWGRYAQLAGLALLPGALILLWQAADTERWHAGSLILAAAALAGAFLAYYRIPFYYATFVLAWGLGHLLPRLRFDARRWLDTTGRLGMVAVLALLLALPHLIDLSGGRLEETVTGTTDLGLDLQLAQVLKGYRQWERVNRYVPWGLLVLAGLAVGWSLARRRWAAASVGLWAVLLASIHVTKVLGMPGAGMMSHFAVQISLYLPASVLVGWLVGEVTGRWNRGRLVWGWTVLLVLIGLWGAKDRLRTLDPSFTLVTRPDQVAMDWIEANTPPDSVFLVNGFTIYSGTSVVGSDAGWWIPLLARRANTMPPQYALFNEQTIVPGYREDVVSLVNQLEQMPLTSAEGLAAACELGVTHLYIGQLQGRVGVPPPLPLFTADDLRSSLAMEPIYHEDRVWVFALADGLCPD